MRYWWVNNKQTFEHEITGNYLWSPIKRRDGGASKFYDNMLEVSVGDIVLSYADGLIRAIGIASGNAYRSQKPDAFNQGVASGWGAVGWLVPVYFKRLTNPFRPKAYLSEIVPLLPAKYSPMQANGNGNQAAYLSEISEELANIIISLSGSGNLVSNLLSMVVRVREGEEDRIENDIRVMTSVSDTEKDQLIRARRGQGVYRANVMEVEKRCRVTGIEDPTHLRASHIKPWRDSDNSERLDGNNGLMLSPHIDHLFDGGFISFGNDGTLIVSAKLDRTIMMAWNIPSNLCVGKFNEKQSYYLDYHRNNIFLS